MAYFLLIITSIITFFGVFKNRIIQNIGGIFLFLTMILIMGLGYINADIDAYETVYNQIDFLFSSDLDVTSFSSWGYFFSTVRNFGFLYINKLFSNLGLTFFEFRFIISILLLGCIFFLVKKLTPNYGMVILLYCIYPFFWDVIQNKNFYVEVIMLYAIYVYSQRKWAHNFKYSVITFFAATFHNIAFIYFPFIILKKFQRFTLIKVLTIGIVITFPLFISIIKGKGQSLILFLSGLNNSFKHYEIYSDQSVGIISLLHWGMIIFVGGALLYLYIQTFKGKEYVNVPIIMKNYLEDTAKLWLYVCLFIPFLAISVDTYRIPRNLFLPFYICVANYSYYGKKRKKLIFIMCLIIVSFYSYMVLPKTGIVFGYIPVPDINTITEILDYNYLFDYFN